MFTEAQNFSIVQTELDRVFFQQFDYDEKFPGVAHATTGEIFKMQETTHAAWIQSVNKGSGLFPSIGETVAVLDIAFDPTDRKVHQCELPGCVVGFLPVNRHFSLY